MTGKAITYWLTTATIALGNGFYALSYISGAMDEAFVHLQMPLYLTHILGVAKILGAVALLSPVFASWVTAVKQWAYAGYTFTFLGAAYAHYAVGDGFGMIFPPLMMLGILMTSYATQPEGVRRDVKQPVSLAA